jgi:hypothetical protein
MITLAEIFESLSHGEFSQLQLGSFNPNEFQSEPDPRQYAQINSYLNSALRAIYSKFWLATGEVIVDLSENREIYRLSSRHAVSNTTSAYEKWIADTVDAPFQDNVLHIEEIYDEGGNTLPLNDETSGYSYNTPTYNSIQVPYPCNETSIAVMYRAAHPRVILAPDEEPSDVEIDIPLQLFDALVFYMASKFYGGAMGSDGQDASFYNKYLNECARVEQAGLFIQPARKHNHFDTNGWV